MKRYRFVKPVETIESPHPGTPDAEVCVVRRAGRSAARLGLPDSACPYDHSCSLNNNRVQWMLGYYDVGLERFYRSPDSGLACDREGVR
jgi:hypothetical protein